MWRRVVGRNGRNGHKGEKKLKKFLSVLMTAIVAFGLFGCTPSQEKQSEEQQDYSIYPKKENVVTDRQFYSEGEVQFPASLWTQSESKRAVSYDYSLYGAQAYFIESVEYKGEKTSFFAYVSIPETATPENPVPGIVLVHGGGGTAFADWVNYWAGLGYAAISIDTEGRVPETPGATSSSVQSTTSPRPHGPSRNGSFLDSEYPIEEQWMYHAIADVVSSVTFLAQFPQVDATKIGCLGISWGSVIVSGAAKYDDRLAFVVPVYGSIGLSGTASREGIAIDRQPRAVRLWDDVQPLKNCRTPFLFVSGQADHAFSLEVLANCAAPLQYKQFLIIQDMTHNHKEYMSVKEIEVFCDNIVFGEKNALAPILTPPTETNSSVKFDETRGKIVSATLFYAEEEGLDADTAWDIEELHVNDGEIIFTLPETARHYFINAVDENGNRVSTQPVELSVRQTED